MSVNQQEVLEASKRLTPKTVKLAMVPPRYDADGNQLYVELIQEPGESMGQLLTRSLQDGSITSDMIPTSVQGSFAAAKDNPNINPRTGLEPPSNMESFLVSSGQARSQQMRGAAAAIAPDTAGTKERNAALQAQDDALLAGSREENPIASFLGDMSGRILPLPGGPVTQGAIAVGEGALNRLGAGQDAADPMAMTADAATGYFGAKLFSPRAPHSTIKATSPQDLYRQQVNLLQSRGLRLSPLEEAKGKTFGVVERSIGPTIEMTPMGQITQAIRLHKQRPTLNKSITSFFTQPRGVLNAHSMQQISNEFGAEFDNILRGTYIPASTVADVSKTARSVLKGDRSGVRPAGKVFKMLDNFVTQNPNGITGEAYTKIRSSWLRQWRSFNNTGATDNADGLMNIIDVYDKAFANAGTVEDVVMSGARAKTALRSGEDRMREYANLRSRWNMFRLVRESTDTANGIVSPHKLANNLKKKNQTQVPQEFRDFVDATASVLRPDVVRSDTASLGTGLVMAGAASDPTMAVLGFGLQPLLSIVNAGTTKQALGASLTRAGLTDKERNMIMHKLQVEMKKAGLGWEDPKEEQ